jgi:UPF0716 protein FxsA
MFLVVLALFVLVPIAELYVIIQVGGEIGVLPTLAILIADSILGAWLLRSQGRAAWARFNQSLSESRVPAREVFDGAMIIFGGALLLTPGFITDVAGLFLLVPPTRALVRRGATALAKRRMGFGWVVTGVGSRGPGRAPNGASPRPDPGPARPSRSYDVEGTATEIRDPHGELDRGGDERG